MKYLLSFFLTGFTTFGATPLTPIDLLSDVNSFNLDGGQSILTGANNLSLYTFDIDVPGESRCTGGCLQVWPPLLSENAEVPAPFGTIKNEDQTFHITLNDQPLYFFQSDKNPGDILGDGLQGVWHLALNKVEAYSAVAQTEEVVRTKWMTDKKGLSLYTFDQDQGGSSVCYDQCAVIWPPLLTEKSELPAPFSVHVRRDGKNQVVFKGSPLYYFVQDKQEGDRLGDGLQGVWHIINL